MIKVLVPDMPLARDIMPYLDRIDASKWYTNFGALNALLEDRLSKMYGAQAVTMSSCTLGLELALESYRIPRGNRVLVPSLSFPATASAVARCGLIPVYADVDPASWMLTPDIARAASKLVNFSAVVPVCAYGAPQNTLEWEEFAEECGVRVVIDAAASFGNDFSSSSVPLVFSMHATKTLGAGEGGFVLTTDAYRATSLRRLSNFGIDPTAGNCISMSVGTNAKLSEYHAAVALAGLDYWAETRVHRVAMHFDYLKELESHCSKVKTQDRMDGGVYNTLVVELPPETKIGYVVGQMRLKGIETRRWYCPPLHRHPGLQFVSDGPSSAGPLTVTEDLENRLLGLPFHMGIDHHAIEEICKALAATIASH